MMLKQIFFNILVYFFTVQALAQNWANANVPLTITEVKCTYVDTVNNKLYISGTIPYSVGIGNAPFCEFDGSAWNYHDTANNIVFAIQKYHNELYIGGWFTTINRQPFPYIAKWNGSNWVNIGGNCDGPVLGLKVYNDELYVVGKFTIIAGIPANKIAKFDGSAWSSLNFPQCNDPGWAISDCAIYKGDLYVGGNFENANGQSDMAVLSNGVWKRVGNSDSIHGSFGGVNKLEVYRNYLYASGLILETEGNVGNGIQAWDGQRWQKVAAGIQGPDNTINSTCGVQDMKQYKGKLFISGNFAFVDHLPSKGIAVWDGIKWCSIDASFDRTIGCFNIFNDTIYIGTYYTVQGVFVNGFAKSTLGNYTRTDACGSAYDLSMKEKSAAQLSVYPNPTFSNLNIVDEQKVFQSSTIEITNGMGQVVMRTSFDSSINVSHLPGGYYILSVSTIDKELYHTKFIKN